MVMIPGLALVFGYDDDAHSRHHVFAAAAMCVNVVVAIPATIQHTRAGSLRRDLFIRIFPAMAAFMVIGVLASNAVSGQWLKWMLAAFIALYCAINLRRVISPRHAGEETETPLAWRTGSLVGSLAGLVGGLLGLGGGVVLVPMLQLAAGVRLKPAVAVSSAVMCLTALIGAPIKVASLHALGRDWHEALWYAAAMAPGAILGSLLGAHLVHRLPARTIRGIVLVVLAIAAIRMAISG